MLCFSREGSSKLTLWERLALFSGASRGYVDLYLICIFSFLPHPYPSPCLVTPKSDCFPPKIINPVYWGTREIKLLKKFSDISSVSIFHLLPPGPLPCMATLSDPHPFWGSLRGVVQLTYKNSSLSRHFDLTFSPSAQSFTIVSNVFLSSCIEA